MKKLKIIVASLAVMLGLVGATPYMVSASTIIDTGCQANPGSEICKQTAGSTGKLNGFVQSIISTLLIILGIIAVIMIIIGGIRYTTSNGESSQITSAKNTILYSVIGLIVAMLAYAIVNFVIGKF